MYLQFETNNYCNAHCAICPHDRMKKRPYMRNETVDRIIDEVVPMASSVLPFLYQEPALDPRLSFHLEKIKKKNPATQTTIYSNMSKMTCAMAKRLIDDGNLDHLVISFYAPNKELYQKYQGGLDYYHTQSNILDFMTLRKQAHAMRPRVSMFYLETPELMDKFDWFYDRWSGIVDGVFPVPFDDFCGDITGFEVPVRNRAMPMHRPVCSRLENPTILSDGTFVPCCLDYNGTVPLGNVNTQGWLEVRDGKVWELKEQMRKGEWDKVPDICKRCSVWLR